MNEDSVHRLGVAVGQTYCDAIASLASLIDVHLADPPRLQAETATLKEEVIGVDIPAIEQLIRTHTPVSAESDSLEENPIYLDKLKA